MGGDVARIERKLQAIMAEKHCEMCARRTETCPACGRPVGGLPGEGDDARRRLTAEIDRLSSKRDSVREMLSSSE